jgi:uncharacterized protein YfaS (alpha-2-macroglobulin family)
VTLTVEGEQLASHSFRKAEYREPRFYVQLKLAPESIIGSGTVSFDTSARYMAGGPLDGASFRMNVTRSLHQQELPEESGYSVGASSWTIGAKYSTWLRHQGVLDQRGMRRISRQTPAPGHWPRAHGVEVEVRSPAGRTVAARSYVIQHPGELYAAIKEIPDDKTDIIIRSVRVVTTQGEARGGRTVLARLLPVDAKGGIRWSTEVWRKALRVRTKGEVLRIPWPKKLEVLPERERDKALGTLTVKPPVREEELLLVLSVTDDAGREAWTAERIHRPTDWSRKQGREQRLVARRDAQLTLTLDKEDYLPGEEATITVRRKGLAGATTLFVERERIFAAFPLRFDARGTARVRLRIEEAFAEQVKLRAVALRRGRSLRDPLGPYVTAEAELRVSDKPYRLGVRLTTDRRVYRPGQRVAVNVRVTDGMGWGRRAQVVLMAVDEAVLQLTSYRLPDPYHRLMRTPPDSVLADDLRRHLLSLRVPVIHRLYRTGGGTGSGTIGLGSMGTVGRGGGGLGKASGKRSSRRRSRFLTTAWHATLVTDLQGRAKTRFTLPDNLTTFRIMAFAVDDRRSAGRGRTSLRVDLPLVSLPVMPRFLRVGDRGTVGLMVQNSGLGRAETVSVSVKATDDTVSLTGPTETRILLGKGRSKTVTFPVQAARTGRARLVFSVSSAAGSGGFFDSSEHVLPVTRTVLSEAASVSGQTRGAVQQGIAPLEQLVPDHGGLDLSLSSTALTGVEEGMEQLIDYPYGCLEQRASRLLPMLAAVALGDRFRLKLPGKPRELIRQGLLELLAMQRSDGGFGYWPNSRKSWPWATAYALIVLKRAQLAGNDIGALVPQRAIRGALGYLVRQLKDKTWRRRGGVGYASRSFVLYAMALHGQDVTRHAKELFDLRHRRPLFARAMLLAALASSKGRATLKSAIELLGCELSDSLRVDGTWAHAEEDLHPGYKVLMHSSDRSTAMVLLALLQARPDHPMAARVVRWFLLGRKQARFRNTQEAAWALMAMWDFARIREQEVPDFEAGVWLGKRRIVEASFRGRSVKPHLSQISMTSLMKEAGRAARSLVVAKRGRGTLYYVARLRYARKHPPQRSRDRGFSVSKRVLVLDNAGRPLKQQRPPRLHDTVLVTLKVQSNEARRYVVIDDPLPAGVEAVDTNLATASRSFGAGNLWRASSRWDHRELRDDRVLFFKDLKQPGTLTYHYLARVTTSGDFAAPPTKAEEMYTPEVYGHTAASKVTYGPH